MSQPEILRWDQAYNRNGDPKLPRTVMNAIRTFMDNDNLTGWVSQETLAEATGMQVRGVRKQIAANVEAGWLEVVKQGCAGRASIYRLTYPKPVPQDRVSEVNTGPTGPVPTTDLNRSHRTGNTTNTGPTGPVNPVPQDRPTSPGTSPQEKFLRETPTGSPAIADQHPTEERRPVGLLTATAQHPTAGPDPLADPFSAESLQQRERIAAEAAARAEERAAARNVSAWD